MTSHTANYPVLEAVVVIERGLSDPMTEDWLTGIDLLSRLGGIPADPATAHSQRPLSQHIRLVRPKLKLSQAATWREIVAAAGAMVESVEASMHEADAAGMAIWLEADCAEMLACSFAVERFGGEGAITEIFFDVTPHAALRFSEPFGQQVLKRIQAGLLGGGAKPYFVARHAAIDEALHALGAPVVVDPPFAPTPRSAPTNGQTPTRAELDIQDITSTTASGDKFYTKLRQRVLELMSQRSNGPMEVSVKGAVAQIVRATPYLEDLASAKIALSLHPEDPENQSALNTLNASPVLRLAFPEGYEDGRVSDPDITALREVRSRSTPAEWINFLVRSAHDAVGYGVKDLSIGDRNIRLDIR